MSKSFKKVMALLSLSALLGAGNAAAAEYAALIEGMPGAVVMSSDVDGFTATQNGTLVDDIGNTAAFMPTVGGGFEIDTDYWRVHLIAGLGVMRHDMYSSTVIKYEAGVYYTAGRHSGFAFGPHVSNYMFVNPSYKGDADLSLSGTSGIAPGLAFTVGDRFIIKGSVDYLMGATFDVDPAQGFGASDDIKLDGLMVQLGVMIRFDSAF